ncbi:MAG: phytanoyl-CoA dioxygenase family protein [Candidatus Latescibacteria bacterium]|jgi:phytanoyl-CoA hydroxylase|nr:phytanoyl-CoA dioxygenase family protein [Candidatus Latescibacterota bacterium]
MSTLHQPDFTIEELETFNSDGFVRLGQVVPDGDIGDLCQRIDDIMLGKIAYEKMLMQLCPSAGKPALAVQSKQFKEPSLKYRKIQDLEQDPLFRSYIQNPLFCDITRKIIGDRIAVFRSMFFNKPAEQGITIDWHQDGAGGWGITIPPKITIWTALDRTRIENGCLQIIPGTHKDIIPQQGDLLSPEEIQRYAPESKRIYLEMEPGEVVLLHNWTLHKSETNHTDAPRRAFSVCYIDSATKRRSDGLGFPQVFPAYASVEQG